MDWQRGKIPYVVLPTKEAEERAAKKKKAVFNPALLTKLHEKGEEEPLQLEEESEDSGSKEEQKREVDEEEDEGNEEAVESIPLFLFLLKIILRFSYYSKARFRNRL